MASITHSIWRVFLHLQEIFSFRDHDINPLPHLHLLPLTTLALLEVLPAVTAPGKKLVSTNHRQDALFIVGIGSLMAAATLDEVLNRNIVAHDVWDYASLDTPWLMGSTCWIFINMAKRLLDGQAAIPEHSTVGVDDINKFSISFVNSFFRTGNIKERFSRIKSCDPF